MHVNFRSFQTLSWEFFAMFMPKEELLLHIDDINAVSEKPKKKRRGLLELARIMEEMADERARIIRLHLNALMQMETASCYDFLTMPFFRIESNFLSTQQALNALTGQGYRWLTKGIDEVLKTYLNRRVESVSTYAFLFAIRTPMRVYELDKMDQYGYGVADSYFLRYASPVELITLGTNYIKRLKRNSHPILAPSSPWRGKWNLPLYMALWVEYIAFFSDPYTEIPKGSYLLLVL